jgi:hypothetical protein
MNNNTNASDAIKELYKLWAADNAIANQKIAMYFIAHGVLLNALNIVDRDYLYLIPFLGIIISLVWLISTARTEAYRKYWKNSISELTKEDPYKCLPLLPDNKDISWYGRVPSWVVLIGSPILGLFLWGAFLLRFIKCI